MFLMRRAPDWGRTSNLQLRRLTLYPIELRARNYIKVVPKRLFIKVSRQCRLPISLNQLRSVRALAPKSNGIQLHFFQPKKYVSGIRPTVSCPATSYGRETTFK